MRQLAASEAGRKEAEATLAALRSSSRREMARLQGQVEQLGGRLEAAETSSAHAAEAIKQGEAEAVAELRGHNDRLRAKVKAGDVRIQKLEKHSPQANNANEEATSTTQEGTEVDHKEE